MKKLLLLFVAVMYMISVHAETYTTTSGTATITSNNTSWQENNVTWALDYTWNASNKTYFALEADGLHIGSSSNYIKNVKMSTSGITGKIKSVTVTSRSNSSTSQLSVSVGTSEFKYGDNTSTGLTTKATPYTFTGDAEGEIVINISNSTSGKNIYIKEVTVEYELGDVTIGELSATCNNAPIENPLTIYQGNDISFHADYATSIEVSVNNQTPTVLTTSDGTATWKPEICNDATVNVVAKREAEGTETQLSNTLTFNLTVKKADYIIADWVVTGIPNVSGGSAINNVALICTPTSATGVWEANHNKSYATTYNNAAQLGSSNNTFNGGTLTLSGSDIPANAIILSISLTGYNNSSTHAVWSIKVGETMADNTITFSNSTATNTADVNLTGNSIVLTCGGGTNIKQTYISGISIKYTIPEEQPGEIVVDYVPQYCLSVDDDKTDLTVMTGTSLRFSSMAAANMAITTEVEGVELPDAVNEANIEWTVPEISRVKVTVTASSESGEKTSTQIYTISSVDILPGVPTYTFDEISKTVKITTERGALQMMVEPYDTSLEENAAATVIAIEAQGWAFTPGDDPKSYEFSYEDMESTMNVSVKSVTPTKESDVVSFYVSNDGQVSGIENVATDVIAGEAVYYNLQGQRVNADRPGMYIRQQGGKAEKLVIR